MELKRNHEATSTRFWQKDSEMGANQNTDRVRCEILQDSCLGHLLFAIHSYNSVHDVQTLLALPDDDDSKDIYSPTHTQ